MKKLLFSVAVIAAASFGVMKANQNNVVLSDLAMENIEMLADAERDRNLGGAYCQWQSYYGDCRDWASGSICLGLYPPSCGN